jgi:hypothetical protein
MKTVERTIGQEHRFAKRRDPAHRPPGAVPVEFVLLGYPVLDAPPLPSDGGDSDGDRDGGDSDGDRDGGDSDGSDRDGGETSDPGAGPGG